MVTLTGQKRVTVILALWALLAVVGNLSVVPAHKLPTHQKGSLRAARAQNPVPTRPWGLAWQDAANLNDIRGGDSDTPPEGEEEEHVEGGDDAYEDEDYEDEEDDGYDDDEYEEEEEEL